MKIKVLAPLAPPRPKEIGIGHDLHDMSLLTVAPLLVGVLNPLEPPCVTEREKRVSQSVSTGLGATVPSRVRHRQAGAGKEKQ